MSASGDRIILALLAAMTVAWAAPQERSVTTEAPGVAERESAVVAASGRRIVLRHFGSGPEVKEPVEPPGQDITSQDTLHNHDGSYYWTIINTVNIRFATRLTMPERATSQCTLRNLRFYLRRDATTPRICSVFVWRDTVVQDTLHYPGEQLFASAFNAGGSIGFSWFNFNMPTGSSAIVLDTSQNFWMGFSRPSSSDPYPTDDGSYNPDFTRNVYAYIEDPWDYWGADFMQEAIVRYGRIEDDVAVTRILTPAGIIDSTASLVPACSVRNLGYHPAGYDVRMRIAGFYDQIVNVADHAETSSIRVEFPPLGAWPRGTWTVNCSTRYAADQYRPNDRRLGTFTVRVVDGRCVQVPAPPETVDVGEWTVPQAVVLNNGTEDAVMQATMRIAGGYQNTLSTGFMLPGTQEVLTFAPWQATAPGSYAVSCSTQLTGDMNPGNDRFSRTVFVRYYDAQAVGILAPADTVDYGASVVPRAIIRNGSNFTRNIPVRMRIGAYNHLGETGPLPPAVSCTLSFPVWSAAVGGWNVATCSTELANDANPANDRAIGGVFVRLCDVRSVSIDLPLANVDSGAPVAPLATVQNLGTTTVDFPVQLTIGAYVGTASVSSLPPGAAVQVAFAPDWQPQRGSHLVRCVTQDPNDMIRANDTLNGSVYVAVSDVGVSAIVSPSGIVASGTAVTPIVNVANRGTEAATCVLRFTIRAEDNTVVYDRVESGVYVPTAGLMGYPFGQNWVAGATGNYTASALTWWAPDQHRENDTAYNPFIVAPPGGILDVGVTAILAPVGSVDTGAIVFPRATVTNTGSYTASFDVAFHITRDGTPVYYDVRPVASLQPATSTTVIFDEWPRPHAEGDYVTRCTTMLANDGNTANDRYIGSFRIGVRPPWPYGWTEMTSMPLGPAGKLIKDGAWLTWDEGTGRIYATKGNKTPDFFAYEPQGDSWSQCDNYPAGAEGRLPQKGAHGCATGAGVVYAVKGNNTLEFHRYTAATNSWYRLDGVPAGPGGKRIKGGADLIYVDLGDDDKYVYLLKGYGNEFYRYNTLTGLWETMEPAPASVSAKYDKGSFLVWDGVRTIYAHQAKYHRLYSYDVLLGTWTNPALPGMPFYNRFTGKTKKSKDGGCASWSGGAVYALKGGNTQDFYRFAIGADSGWVDLDTIPVMGRSSPKRKRVKGGGDITSYASGVLFAIKGNKTNELWRYVAGGGQFAADPRPDRDGVMARPVAPAGSGVQLQPNPPLAGRAVLRYALPGPVPATVEVFDVTGRRVWFDAFVAGAGGTRRLDLDGLAAGAYLLRFTAGDRSQVQKFVIER